MNLPSQLGLENTPTGKTPPLNEIPGYDTKQSDGEVPVIAPRSTLARNGCT